jgi:hypothetical protein
MADQCCVACRGALDLFGPAPAGDYTYYQCRDCGSLQLWPMPSAADLKQAYASAYDAGVQLKKPGSLETWAAAARPYRECMIRALKAHKVQGPVVDCGAGWGFLVEDMIKAGFDARGVELSHEQAALAQGRGVPVQQGELGSLQGLDGKVSAVTMFAVFEHLVDHAGLLADIHRVLARDGLYITAHPTARFFSLLGQVARFGNKHKRLPDLGGAYEAPWHTALFSLAATEQVISRSGFRLLEIRPVPQGRFGNGLYGLSQRVLEAVNKVGWALAGQRWPLMTTHAFVFRKV